MNSHPRPLSIFLLFCLALFADAALGQSLSLIRNGGSGFSIVGAAPLATPYVLQESANLHLWVDLTDGVSGQFTNQFAGAAGQARFFRLTPWTEPAPDIIIVLLGDSTVADFISNNSERNGWGQGIYGYFKPNVRVVNLAYPCYSTKVFLASAEKTKLLAIKPDFVFVQFGLIDALGCGEDASDRYVTTLPEYADNLKTIVQMVRGFNGTPILITQPAMRIFDGQGNVYPLIPDHCAAVKNVAAELQTPLIDLNELSMDLFRALGESGSAYISMAANDPGHFSSRGAQVIAGLVVNAFPANFGPYLTNIFDSLPTP